MEPGATKATSADAIGLDDPGCSGRRNHQELSLMLLARTITMIDGDACSARTGAHPKPTEGAIMKCNKSLSTRGRNSA